MKRGLFVAIICSLLLSIKVLTGTVHAQVRTVPIGELTDSLRFLSKPALILISTDWCKFCQMQKAQLRKSRDFAELLDNYYFSEFNAESTDEIQFNNQTYHFSNTGVKTGTHDLAVALGQTEKGLSYPTWVLIDPGFHVVFRYGGVLQTKILIDIMKAHLLESERK